MRFPVDDFYTKWNITAGFGFGQKTDYGSHEAVDLNDNLGGNNDLGKPLYAIAKGIVTSVHNHTTKPSFGKHLHIKIDGKWGTRYVHYAHCDTVLVKEGDTVEEGQQVATVGNSGTVWAHCHLALKKEPTGIDAIAKTLDDLKKWEDPIKFIEAWMKPNLVDTVPIEKSKLEDLERCKRIYNNIRAELNVQDNETIIMERIKMFLGLEEALRVEQKKNQQSLDDIKELKQQVTDKNTQYETLKDKIEKVLKEVNIAIDDNSGVLGALDELEKQVIKPIVVKDKPWYIQILEFFSKKAG